MSDAISSKVIDLAERVTRLEYQVNTLAVALGQRAETPTASPGPSHLELQSLRAQLAAREQELEQARAAAKPPIELEPAEPKPVGLDGVRPT